MSEYNLKQYAHIGDAVWELFIREKIVKFSPNLKLLHQNTVKFVRAEFQSQVLTLLALTDEERELIKRGRNLPLTINKKNNQSTHRYATAFEVLIGYLYLNNKERLCEIFEFIEKNAL